MINVDDIIWFEAIVEKLAWKHNILPADLGEDQKGQDKWYLPLLVGEKEWQ